MAEDQNIQATGGAQSAKKKDWDPNRRYWKRPKDRGKQYAEELRAKVHTDKYHEGEELTEYDKGVRSGYLQCQSDHTGAYTYKKVAEETEGTEKAKRKAAKAASRDKHYWSKRKAAGNK